MRLGSRSPVALLLSSCLLVGTARAQTADFAAQAVGPTAQSPHALALGDVDGDGRQDLVVPDAVGLRVFWGAAAGSFDPPTVLATPATAWAAALADFDRDGLLDLAAGSPDADALFVLRNAGARSFAEALVLPVGADPLFLVAGDFDGDGAADLATTCSGAARVDLLFGDGDGGFDAPSSVAGLASGRGLVAGDLDRDGDVDLALSSHSSSQVQLLLNQGGRGFEAGAPIPVGASPYFLEAADLDRDGDLDLLSAGFAGGVTVLVGDGGGGFAAAAEVAFGSGPTSVRSADFDGDGRPDLAVSNCNTNNVVVRLGLGGPALEFGPPLSLPSAGCPHALVAGDLDGDGRPDLASTQWYGEAASVFLNRTPWREAGLFTAARQQPIGATPRDVVAGDWNGDGRMDVATADRDSQQVSILLGRGDGSFDAAPPHALGFGVTALESADFDRDGNADLFVVGAQQEAGVLLGDGAGGFTRGAWAAATGTPLAAALGDFDRDGDVDALVATLYADSWLLANDGAGGFGAPLRVGSGGGGLYSPEIVAADLDRDGRLDHVTGAGPNLTWSRGDGTGGFAAPAAIDAGHWTGSLGAADLDRDGWPDLLVGGSSLAHGQAIAVLRGDGAGGLEAPVHFPVDLGPVGGLTVVDLDRDGRLDVVVPGVDSGVQSLAWLPGDGAGGLGEAVLLDIGIRSEAAAAADLRGTGRLDLVAPDLNATHLGILLNDRCEPLDTRLVGWWPGDGDLADHAGDRGASAYGDAGRAPGFVGEGFAFDGDGDFLTAPHGTVLVPTGALSFGAWLRRREEGAGVVMMKSGPFGAPEWMSYGLSVEADGRLGVWLPDAEGGVFDSEPGLVEAERWTHVFVTWDGNTGVEGNVALHVDGRVVERFDKRGPLRDSDGNLSFGGLPYYGAGGVELEGELDELMVFAGHLEPAEVHALWQAGSAGPCELDRSPDPFEFEPLTGLVPGSLATSESVQPAGYLWPARLDVTGGEQSRWSDLNSYWTDWSTEPAELRPGDLVRLRGTAPVEPGAESVVELTVGGTTAAFRLRSWTHLPGDFHPPGGDGLLTLADFVHGHRKALGLHDVSERDVAVMDVAPGTLRCEAPQAPDHWCATGDGVFGLEDFLVLRAVLAGVLVPSCEDCSATAGAASGAELRLPGDLAPAGGDGSFGDGGLDVADVLKLLRLAVQLDEAGPEQALRGDVAPAESDGPLSVVRGDGRLDVADVLLVLRAAVGLESLRWPAREVLVVLGEARERLAFRAVTTGWPAWAEPAGWSAEGCAVTGGLDVDEGRRVVTCAWEEEPRPDATELAALAYRGPEAVDLSSLAVAVELLDAQLQPLPAQAALAERD